MEVKAITRYVRIAPQRVRQVVDLIRGQDVEQALAVLEGLPKRGAVPVAKTLKSAVANAQDRFELGPDELMVSRAYVDQGPTLKRFRPRAMGRADVKRRRSCHITVVVREKEEV